MTYSTITVQKSCNNKSNFLVIMLLLINNFDENVVNDFDVYIFSNISQ